MAWEGLRRSKDSSASLLLALLAGLPRAAAAEVSLPFVLVSDLDRASLVAGEGSWRAFLRYGELLLDDAAGGCDAAAERQQQHCPAPRRRYRVRMGREEELRSRHAYRGRGMELSDLALFGDPPELWSVCDSTGILHRLAGPLAAEGPRSVLPQRVLLDDGGTSHLPAKSEWMAVKDGLLHVGGHGKEWVSGGVIRGRGAEWVRVISDEGALQYQDWRERYGAIRNATGTSFPGYLSHEAVDWDAVHRRWVIAPRKAQASDVPGGYDDLADEQRGTNLLLQASEDFRTIRQTTVGSLEPAWGASGLRLLPAGADTRQARHALIVRSSEVGGSAQSSLGVFSVEDGQPMDSSALWHPVGPRKYEGVAWLIDK